MSNLKHQDLLLTELEQQFVFYQRLQAAKTLNLPAEVQEAKDLVDAARMKLSTHRDNLRVKIIQSRQYEDYSLEQMASYPSRAERDLEEQLAKYLLECEKTYYRVVDKHKLSPLDQLKPSSQREMDCLQRIKEIRAELVSVAAEGHKSFNILCKCDFSDPLEEYIPADVEDKAAFMAEMQRRSQIYLEVIQESEAESLTLKNYLEANPHRREALQLPNPQEAI